MNSRETILPIRHQALALPASLRAGGRQAIRSDDESGGSQMRLVLGACVGAVVIAATAAVPLVAGAAVEKGTVTGQVTGTGLDLTGYQAVVSNSRRSRSAPIEEDGSFSITGVPVGTYEAGLYLYDEDTGDEVSTRGGELTVEAGTTTTHDIEYGLVHGTVTAGGNPFTRGSVSAFEADQQHGWTWAPIDSSTGMYELVVIVDGDDRLFRAESYSRRWAGQYYDGVSELSEATPVPVAVDDDLTIDFDLPRAVVVKGTVANFPHGATWIDKSVRMSTLDGDDVGWGGIGRTGAFRVSPVPPGDYLLSFARSSGPALTMGTLFQGIAEKNAADATVVEVSGDGTVELPPVSAKRGATITGTIVDRSGAGRRDLRVVAVPTDHTISTRSAWTVRSGAFRITGVGPGTYRVFVWNGQYPTPGARSCTEKRIGTVTVRDGGTRKVGRETFTAKKRC